MHTVAVYKFHWWMAVIMRNDIFRYLSLGAAQWQGIVQWSQHLTVVLTSVQVRWWRHRLLTSSLVTSWSSRCSSEDASLTTDRSNLSMFTASRRQVLSSTRLAVRLTDIGYIIRSVQWRTVLLETIKVLVSRRLEDIKWSLGLGVDKVFRISRLFAIFILLNILLVVNYLSCQIIMLLTTYCGFLVHIDWHWVACIVYFSWYLIIYFSFSHHGPTHQRNEPTATRVFSSDPTE